jgi:quercetin dioxygenase-like cupin family protein
MLTRRAFAACALCAAGGFFATGTEAQTPGLRRILLKRTDGPTAGFETLEMRVEFDPGVAVPRHTHPGVESGYVVEGGVELTVDGESPIALGAGDAFQVPTARPHSARNGAAKTVLADTYVVEKGKPLASPA